MSFAPSPKQSTCATPLVVQDDGQPLDVIDEQPAEAGEQDRAMSELLEGLLILSSGGKRSSTTSSAINENLDVPQIAVEREEEEGEEDFGVAEVVSRGSSSFETSGVDLGHRLPPPQTPPYLSTAAPPVFTPSFSWPPPEGTEAERSSSSSYSQYSGEVFEGVEPVPAVASFLRAPVGVCEGDPPSIEEEFGTLDEEIRDIRVSGDGKLDVSALSDDQWTLRAESVDESPDPNGKLPRYSQLLYSPSKATFFVKNAILPQLFGKKANGKPEPGVMDENFQLKSAVAVDAPNSPPPSPLYEPPIRSTSLTQRPSRRLRPRVRTELLCNERPSQQWDREKVAKDVQRAIPLLGWDKAQRAWQIVREASQVSPTRLIKSPKVPLSPPPPPRHPSSPRDGILFTPTTPTASSPRPPMLPPGKMEWAFVDSAAPDPTRPPSRLLFRLCIAWRVAIHSNAIKHPFGAQEEIKVFVLGRTHEEFYQLYQKLMGRFMLEPRRHPWTRSDEVGPRARASLDPMAAPDEEEEIEGLGEFASGGKKGEQVRERVKAKVDALEAWTQGLMRLKGTKMAYVLESDLVRMWMAPQREGDCERAVDNWQRDGHGEIGRDPEGIAKVLERLW